jgi:hypothetical protein
MSECEDHPHAGEMLDLSGEVGPATLQLLPRGPVIGWCAPGCRGDVAVGQRQTVFSRPGVGLIGPPVSIQRMVQPIAAGVAGEYPTGPVAPVSRGCQTDDQKARVGVAKTGHRPPPILLVGELPFASAGHLGAMRPESRAELASADPIRQAG